MRQRRGTGTRPAWVGLVVGLALLGVGPAAWAQPLNWNRPAATLLLPYFEVDLADATGETAIFSINNASATAILAHVVVWSDMAVPVLAFNVYLTGYDVQEVDLGQIVRNGILPATATAGQDPNDTISPHGAFSQDINFFSCSGQLPYPAPALSLAQLQGLQAGLTGGPNPILGNLCCGFNFGDHKARGYVTVDTVNNCTFKFPGDAGYFVNGGAGDATNQNVLYGDYFATNPRAGLGRGHALVHIVAYPGVGITGTNPSDPATTTSGRYTFYGRYNTPPWTAADNRVPLATAFATRFRNGGTGGTFPSDAAGSAPSGGGPDPFFPGLTQLEVWRDPKVAQHAFTCPAAAGFRPPWFPLGQEGIVIFDEQEHQITPAGVPVFPLATQRVQLGSGAFQVPFPAGWMYLDLNTTVAAAGPNPSVDSAAAQAWVTIVENGSGLAGGALAAGLFSTGYPAVPLDSAEAATHFVP